MKIFTKEQFEEHNKKILSEKEDNSSKNEISWIDIMYDFLSDIKKIKDDTQIIESELEKKSESDHTHEEFTQINDKISNLKENISKIKENISSEIKNVKSSIKHYDDNPVLERINTIQEEVKTLEERVSWIKIPEINLTGFLKEKDIKNLANKKEIGSLANKDDVYTKEETYNKDEVYNKNETYNREEIDNKVNSRWNTQTLLWSTNYITDLLDVRVTEPTEWQTLVYNETNKRWENWVWWWPSTTYSKLLELEWLSWTLTYNGNNQVDTVTYSTCIVVNTYNGNNQIATTVYTFSDATVITMTATYSGTTLTWFNYS